MKRLDAHVPEVGEMVLMLGEEKNRGRWKKEKVIRIVRGADGVARGMILLYKGLNCLAVFRAHFNPNNSL